MSLRQRCQSVCDILLGRKEFVVSHVWSFKIRKQDNIFSTSLFREIPILTNTHHMKEGHAGAADSMSVAYDLEGFTSSTLRSKGCGAGVGVEEVCPALVTVAEGFCLGVPYHLCRCGSRFGLGFANARRRVRYALPNLEFWKRDVVTELHSRLGRDLEKNDMHVVKLFCIKLTFCVLTLSVP